MSSKRESLSSKYVSSETLPCFPVALLIQRVLQQDIFRKYPHSYEAIIPTLCSNLDELDEPDAKASLIWIIGEYAEKIENADELLSIFLDTFKEEFFSVSTELLLVAAKLNGHG